MSCHAYQLTTKVSSPQKVYLNQLLPGWWLVPSYFPESYNASFVWSWLWRYWRERVYLVLVYLKSFIFISVSLDYWSIHWHLCSTITLLHLIFWSGWTSRAHLMYPVLSCYQVSQDHVHLLPMNMTALMVCILRVEERGNVLLKQLTLIAGLKYKISFQTGSRHTQVQGTISQQAKMCFPEWALKKQPALWMASWNIKAIVVSQVCCIKQA